MADKKISALTAATTPLAGTEVLPIVQSGSTVKVSIADVTAGRSVSASGIVNSLGAVGTPSYTFTGDLNTGMWSPAADTIAMSTAGAERMRLTAAGNLGIGTTSPGSYTDYTVATIAGTNGGILQLRNSASTVSVEMATIVGNEVYMKAVQSTPLWFGTANTERMRIDSTGYISLGTGAAGQDSLLVFSGGISGTPFRRGIKLGTDPDGQFDFYINSNQNNSMFRWINGNGSTELMRLNSAGNLGLGTSSPTSKLQVVGAGIFQLSGAGSTTPLILRNNDTTSTQVVKLGFDNGGVIKASINAAVYNNDFMTFNVGSDTERMRIDASGNVGIGTSSPSAKVEAAGTGVLYSLKYTNDAGSALIAWKNTSGTTLWDIGGGVATAQDELAFRRQGSTVMLLDSSGNLGLGVTPSAWGSTSRALQFSAGAIEARGAGLSMNANAYFNGANWIYSTSAGAALYNLTNGSDHQWYVAASGTAGNAITFTQAMTLPASGNLGIGTSSPSYRLHVVTSGTNAFRVSGPVNVEADVTDGTVVLRQQVGGSGAFGTVGAHDLVLRTSNTERARITSGGNLQLGTASLATTATDGFPYIPTCAGTPTGTPTAITGYAPMVVDSTNNKLYVYVGGAWQAMN